MIQYLIVSFVSRFLPPTHQSSHKRKNTAAVCLCLKSCPDREWMEILHERIDIILDVRVSIPKLVPSSIIDCGVQAIRRFPRIRHAVLKIYKTTISIVVTINATHNNTYPPNSRKQ